VTDTLALVLEGVEGRRIVLASWVTNVAFAASAVPVALGAEDLEIVAAGVALGAFAIGLGVWTVAFSVALARTARGDDVVVANLFFLQGSAPRRVQRHLFASLAVDVAIVAVTAWQAPFGVLVPMLPVGLIGLWGARHGTFPPRARRSNA